MNKSRLEAFSDGVMAIIITIMVLELKAPHEGTLDAIQPVVLPFLGYVLSFIYVGIYWNNHHHLFNTVKQVSGGVLWANLHLLFWLSLFPVVTNWVGESHLGALPVAAYGVVLLMAALAYSLLQWTIMHQQGKDSLLARAVGSDIKGKISPLLYGLGIVTAFWHGWISALLFAAVAGMWLVPDRRIERELKASDQE